jgi:gephyrin
VTSDLAGHILAEDVFAPQNVPFALSTNVDGYALHSSSSKGVYDVVTPQTHSIHQRLPLDTIMRVNTGAPLPYGTNAVIMVEDTRLVSTTTLEDGQEESQVETLAEVKAGENVRQPGSDVMKGEKVCEMGELIGHKGGEIGTLAFVGRQEVGSTKFCKVLCVPKESTGESLQETCGRHSKYWR